MLLPFLVFLILIAAGFGLQLLTRMRSLEGRSVGAQPTAPKEDCGAGSIAGDRYRPMLRLLSDDDLRFVPAHLRATVRADRRMIFRRYLRCLARDYGRLLAGVRMAMVRSGIDRPELARALAKNRILFAMALCQIEYRLTLHAAGLGHVDVGHLVDALDSLRRQVAAFTPAASGAAA